MATDNAPDGSQMPWYRPWWKWVIAWLGTLWTGQMPFLLLVLGLLPGNLIGVQAWSTAIGQAVGQLLGMAMVIFLFTLIVRKIRAWRREGTEQPPDADAAAES